MPIQIRHTGQIDSRGFLQWKHGPAEIAKLDSLGLVFAEDGYAIGTSKGGVYAVSGNVTPPPNLKWSNDCFYGINIVRPVNCPPNSATGYKQLAEAYGTPPIIVPAELTFIPVTFPLSSPDEVFSIHAFFNKCPTDRFLSGNLWINKP